MLPGDEHRLYTGQWLFTGQWLYTGQWLTVHWAVAGNDAAAMGTVLLAVAGACAPGLADEHLLLLLLLAWW